MPASIEDSSTALHAGHHSWHSHFPPKQIPRISTNVVLLYSVTYNNLLSTKAIETEFVKLKRCLGFQHVWMPRRDFTEQILPTINARKANKISGDLLLQWIFIRLSANFLKY